jgi:hypothetical protein
MEINSQLKTAPPLSSTTTRTYDKGAHGKFMHTFTYIYLLTFYMKGKEMILQDELKRKFFVSASGKIQFAQPLYLSVY